MGNHILEREAKIKFQSNRIILIYLFLFIYPFEP